MREILFRGKANNGKWVYGVPVPVTINCYVKGVEIIDEEGIEYDELDGYNPVFGADRVDPETVGQFTGLTDCAKKKLFEHDVVTAKFKSNGARYNFKIIFKEGAFLFDNGSVAVRFDQIRSAVKIGNIHDNPELWKVL